jgi:hypothetical protein
MKPIGVITLTDILRCVCDAAEGPEGCATSEAA